MPQRSAFPFRSAVLTRRRLLTGGGVTGAGLIGAVLVGCRASAPKAAAGGAGGSPAAAGPSKYPAGSQVPEVKGTPKNGGQWTVAAAETSPQQDMHTANSQSIWTAMSERAMHPDPWTNEIRGNIVEKWETPDPTHFIFHIRQGVKIHNKPPWNGRDFDAEDMAFNINRIGGNTAAAEGLPKASFQRASSFADVKALEVVDRYTLRITMAKPSSAFLNGLTFYKNKLMPKGIVEVGFKDPMKFAGLGAYQLTEFTPGVREVYTRFPDYYRKGEPHFDKFVRTVIPDKAGQIAGFISRQLSSVSGITPQDEKTIRAARPDALLYTTPGLLWSHLRLNMKLEVFKDIRVRKALQLMPNYAEIGDGYYGPGWTYTGPLCSAFGEAWSPEKVKGLAGFNPATKDRDRAEANKLLDAAGHAGGDGVAFEILFPSQYTLTDALQSNAIRFQGQAQQVFPKMKVAVRPSGDTAAFDRAQAGRTFQVVSYNASALPELAGEAYDHYHSKGARNFGSFDNAEADALIEKALTELNPNARKEIFETFQQKYVNDWQSVIHFYVSPTKVFVQPNIGGYDTVVGPWATAMSEERSGALYEVA